MSRLWCSLVSRHGSTDGGVRGDSMQTGDFVGKGAFSTGSEAVHCGRMSPPGGFHHCH